MNVKTIHATVGVVTALLAAGLGGCGRKPPAESARDAAPVRVRTFTVATASRTANEEVAGTVRAKLSAVIAAKISGAIESLAVAPGEAVKAGELLALLDAREIKARLDQAIAVRDQAALDYARHQRLIAEKAVSQQEFDAVESRFRTATAAVKEAETMLGYTRITAPFAGLVTRKRADVGDLATPGRPLLELEDPQALRLEADVSEALIGNVHLGDTLTIQAGTPPRTVQGVVAEIAPAAEAVSRTFLVKLDLPTDAGLRSGQFARVAVPVGNVNLPRVPRPAVHQRGQMETVFVVRDGRAWLRLIKTGKAVGPEVEIVSGLSDGETVVVESAAAPADGQLVTTRQ